MWIAVPLLAATAVACGGTTQSMLGTAPSSVSAVAATPDAGGTFGMLKEGKGKSPDKGAEKGPDKGPDKGVESPAPVAGTAPTVGGAPDTDVDDPDTGDDRGHGHAMTQIEGLTTSIAGSCPNLTIKINGLTVTTDVTTEFERVDCANLAPAVTTTTPTTGTTPAAGTTPTASTDVFRLHIAAKADATGKLVASYVRMQGPKKGGDDDAADDDTTTTPTTGTTPTK